METDVLISAATSSDERERSSGVAVLPVGSFEQHGSHLPLTTDTLIACAIARHVAVRYELFLLPPVTMACSQEHAEFAGTVSVSSSTLSAIIRDVISSLVRSGIQKVAIINAHGGNYVLSNVTQEVNNEGSASVVLFPRGEDWNDARHAAELFTDNHTDMHGGEAETSILLAETPEVVRPHFAECDEIADERRHLLTLGMQGYTKSGIIGRPSLASADKGRRLLAAFGDLFLSHLEVLG